MPQNKNQHYVPQFYQRYFSDEEANTGVYILKAKKYMPNSAIKHQASADYFYSKNLKIEKGLGVAEGMVKAVLDGLIANPRKRLGKEQQVAIYTNIILQMGRTLYQAKKQEAAITAIGKQFVEAVIQADKESGKGEYADIPQEAIDSTKIKLTEPGAYVRISNTDDVNELNKMLATQANEILIVQDSMASNVDLEALGRIYDTYHNEGNPIGVKTGTDSAQTTILGVISTRIDCQCRLSFVKQRTPYVLMRGETFDIERYMYRETAKRVK